MKKTSLFLSLAALLGCGGSQPAPTPPVVDEPVTEVATPTWAELDDNAAHQNFVRERALIALEATQDDLEAAQLDAYLASPDTAPMLTGRAVDKLFDVAAADLAAGNLDRAEQIVRMVRARAKNRNSAFAGNTFLSEIARRRAGDDTTAQEAAIAGVFRELPRARFGSATVVFQILQTQEQLAARLGQIKEQLVSLDTASSALFMDQLAPAIVSHRDHFLAAIATVRAEHAALPPEESYAFSTVDLGSDEAARPVNIAVWDVGTNQELFPDQTFINEAEPINGEDDDGNGQVDDRHGITDEGAHTELLYRPSPETLTEYTPFLRGIMDLRAGIADSEGAQRVLTLMRSATDPQAVEALETNLDAVGEWAHGTHVAGIMLAGVPQARMAVFRSAWAGEARLYHHRGPTDAELDAERANIDAIAEYINRHQIRVVNASLGFGQDYVEAQLRHESETYTTDAQVVARATAIHQRRAANWRSVFEACPDTLFVVAAGNSNRDVVEYEDVPGSFDYPNLLIVGAVDRFGGWATFTNSNPDRVKIFDHGVEVESLIPNGQMVPLSGTSMASPNVANLATKMMAVNAELTPTQAIAIILETGDPIAAPFNGRIANEQAAVDRARSL